MIESERMVILAMLISAATGISLGIAIGVALQ